METAPAWRPDCRKGKSDVYKDPVSDIRYTETLRSRLTMFAAQSVCAVCHNEAFKPGPSDTTSSTLVLVYLCRHTVHASCALLNDDIELPSRQDNQSVNHLLGSGDKLKSRRRSGAASSPSRPASGSESASAQCASRAKGTMTLLAKLGRSSRVYCNQDEELL